MDATTSFVYLTDNLPNWIEDVKTLSTHASKKHAEYVAEYNRRLAHVRLKKERTPSLRSIHTDQGELHKSSPQIIEPASESMPQPLTVNALHISPLEAGNKYLLAQAQRKRKLGSSIRSGASGPQKFRSKHMVVIYYDAYLQQQLEILVKSTGAARNNLRKGRLSRSATRGFQLPSLGRDTDNGIRSFDSFKKFPTSSVSVPTDPKTALFNHKPTGDAVFIEADKHLEEAQSLCEIAAHQVLRDGDCTIELDDVVAKLESVLELAAATVVRLRDEDAKDKEKETEDRNRIPADAYITQATDITSSPSPTHHSSTSKLIPSLNEKIEYSSPAFATSPGAVAEIEVDDDSDGSSIVVDISKFRSVRTRSQALRP